MESADDGVDLEVDRCPGPPALFPFRRFFGTPTLWQLLLPPGTDLQIVKLISYKSTWNTWVSHSEATSYASDPAPTNVARTLSESSGVKVSIRRFPARPSSNLSV